MPRGADFCVSVSYSHSLILVLVFLHRVYRLGHISENKIAMRIISLHNSISCSSDSPAHGLTCNLPCSSLSPRSFTNTSSSKQSRTRSNGSLAAGGSGAVSAMISLQSTDSENRSSRFRGEWRRVSILESVFPSFKASASL
jgi:hypothetical protein